VKALDCFEIQNAGENVVPFLLFLQRRVSALALKRGVSGAHARAAIEVMIADSGPKWHAPPCSESAGQKKNFRPQRKGLQGSSIRRSRMSVFLNLFA